MIDTDKYLSSVFDIKSYNCWHFVKDVWLELRGQLLEVATVRQAQVDYVELPAPRSPCLVLMEAVGQVPHVGVYLNGKVLHLKQNGAWYQPLEIASVGFQSTSFYVPR